MDQDRKNYYEVLEISTQSSPQEIERAYIRAKNSYSGDSVAMYSLMTAEECSQILEQIEEAYSVLGFPEKRREYDRIRGFNQGAAASSHNFAEHGVHVDAPTPVTRPTPVATPLEQTTLAQEEIRLERPAAFQYEDYSSNANEAKVSKIAALKKFSLDYQVDNEFEQKIESTSEFVGSLLRSIREYKNVTLDRMAEMTRVSRTYLQAIEEDNVSKLPAEVYTRGFVYQYAKCLKLNPELVATSYLHHMKKLKSTK